jgi:hypothetical protein
LGNLSIQYNFWLDSLRGLNNIEYIGGDLIIAHCYDLRNLKGLESLVYIGGGLGITGNLFRLTSLNGLNNLDTIGGYFGLTGNGFVDEGLTNLSGLDDLKYIGGDIIIIGNDSLINLNGLENLNTIGGYINIGDGYLSAGNKSLVSLSGLNNLTSIGVNSLNGGGDIRIHYNESLQDIEAIENINYESIFSLSINFNPLLSNCDVQSICGYLVAPNGTVEIYDNAAGCNSQQEVEEACGITGINVSALVTQQSSINLYPNPSSSKITIELPTQLSKNTFLSISNTNGQQLITQLIKEPQTEIDIRHLPVGIYIVKVWNDKGVMIQKVIKQ